MSFQTLQMSLPLSPETPCPQGTRRPSALSLLSGSPQFLPHPHTTPLCPSPLLLLLLLLSHFSRVRLGATP